MKAIMTSRGSRGDVHPIVEIGSALQSAGFDISICVPKLFDSYAIGRGLSPFHYSEDSELVMQQLGSGWKAIRTALDWFSRSIEEQFDFMLRESEDADVMITSVNEVAAPTVAEYRNIPHFRIAYTPVLPGYHPPPLIPWQGLPGIVNKSLWHAINGLTGFFFKSFLNKKREELGLGPIAGTGRYFTDRSHTIMTLNPKLAPPCRTWFDNYEYSYSGYCYGDINGSIDPGLAAFIKNGPAPVYIGFGSVNVKDPEGFTRLTLEALKRTDCRAILGAGWTGLGGSNLPETVFTVGDTNHATLFPLCAGIAHHGGSGTVHTAARAGIPQFIMPQIADQFYWGHRIHKLRLGPKPVVPDKITVEAMARSIQDLAGNATYAANAKSLSEEMKQENGVFSVVEIISRELQTSPPQKNHSHASSPAR